MKVLRFHRPSKVSELHQGTQEIAHYHQMNPIIHSPITQLKAMVLRKPKNK